MRGFESPSQFNPEKQPEKIEQPSQPPVEQVGGSSSSKIMETLGGAKERISAYLKYKGLKVKEYFGQLNQEDFDQLLDFDFQEQLRDTPPIKGIFSPEDELAKIKSLPREQKREAIATFKENLARQREALAACRVFIERSIEFNHDVSREELASLIEKFGRQYGFNDQQKQIAEQIIDGYYENRQKVLEIRQQFTDDHELVSNLTGVNLGKDEKLDVAVGPMSIDIDTEGFNAGRLYEKADQPIISFKYGGFASQSVGENPVYYVVINQDKWIRTKGYDDPTGEKTRRHEYEHQKNKLFRAVFEYQDAPNRLVGYIGETDPEVKKVILEDFLSESRTAALERARDEITACLYDRTLPQLQRQLGSLFFEQKNDLYDYLAYLRNWEKFKDDPFYQETAQRMLVQEYRATVENAVGSYAELVSKGKYSTQEATAFLTDKPLADWPKTIKRLLEQKEAS